jgi:hypothetical protein
MLRRELVVMVNSEARAERTFAQGTHALLLLAQCLDGEAAEALARPRRVPRICLTQRPLSALSGDHRLLPSALMRAERRVSRPFHSKKTAWRSREWRCSALSVAYDGWKRSRAWNHPP